MSRTEKMPVKTFWEAVEGRLVACSADELRAVLRAMARETPPSGRRAFLEKLQVEETSIAAEQTIQQEELLAEIDNLAQELKAAMAEADNWEERYEWGEYYDEEDSLGPYEEFAGGWEEENPLLRRLEGAYAEQFAQASVRDEGQEEILLLRLRSVQAWCLDVAQQRVNAIGAASTARVTAKPPC